MRVPAAVFASRMLGKDIDSCIRNALMCTHNNSIALESAFAYAYSLSYALDNAGTCTTEDLLEKALEGCRKGMEKAPWISAGATLEQRLRHMLSLNIASWDEDRFKAFLYGVLGTGLPSYETSSSVFALLIYTDDPVRTMFLSSELGGDTDTIGALACSLASIRNLEASLPEDIEKPVLEFNRITEYLR